MRCVGSGAGDVKITKEACDIEGQPWTYSYDCKQGYFCYKCTPKKNPVNNGGFAIITGGKGTTSGVGGDIVINGGSAPQGILGYTTLQSEWQLIGCTGCLGNTGDFNAKERTD